MPCISLETLATDQYLNESKGISIQLDWENNSGVLRTNKGRYELERIADPDEASCFFARANGVEVRFYPMIHGYKANLVWQ